MHHPTDRIAHTTAFVIPVVVHWLEGEIAQWVHPMKDRSDDPSHHERTLLPRSYISLPEMPIGLDPVRLEDGDGIEETLRRNKAQYHQSCRLMFNNTKLERARKRRAESAQPVECQTKLRRTSLEGQTCFICDKEALSSELRQVMTMNLNNRLNECVQTLNDGKPLARLSGGDAIAQKPKYYFHT